MQMRYHGRCNAPKLENTRLVSALAHQSGQIKTLATIVQAAKNSGKIPRNLPNMQTVDNIQTQITGLTGESRHVAYHVLWYVKELILGRHPDG